MNKVPMATILIIDDHPRDREIPSDRKAKAQFGNRSSKRPKPRSAYHRLRLRQLIRRRTGSVRYVEHLVGSGGDFFEVCCQDDLEGIVIKRGMIRTIHRGR